MTFEKILQTTYDAQIKYTENFANYAARISGPTPAINAIMDKIKTLGLTTSHAKDFKNTSVLLVNEIPERKDQILFCSNPSLSIFKKGVWIQNIIPPASL